MFYRFFDFFRNVRYAWQRVVRGYGGYDDRILWEFDSWFWHLRPAVKKFLENEFAEHDGEYWVLNPDRRDVYSKAWALLLEWEALEEKRAVVEGRGFEGSSFDFDAKKWAVLDAAVNDKQQEFWGFFGSHIGLFWD